MKSLLVSILVGLLFSASALVQAQQHTVRSLDDFDKVVVSDKIDLVLTEGDQNTIQLDYVQTRDQDIITRVTGKKLRIYLTGCRFGCDDPHLVNRRVVAYLTYKTLKKLVVMGENEVINRSDINVPRFVLRAMGDSDISLNGITADRWKIALYGDSKLSVEDGKVGLMKIKSFGDNDLFLHKVSSRTGKVHIFGDSQLNLQVQDKMSLTVFGDAAVYNQGNPWVSHRWVFGELTFESL